MDGTGTILEMREAHCLCFVFFISTGNTFFLHVVGQYSTCLLLSLWKNFVHNNVTVLAFQVWLCCAHCNIIE